MNDKSSNSTLENGKQSVGNDSRNKRNSGLFSFFKWLKQSGSASRESLNSDKANNNSSSCESLSSVQSCGTVASFSFVEPSAYSKNLTEKKINLTPETDTYKARLDQRDKRREKDKNLTLRKKYNLFFNRDTLLRTVKPEENTKSLPLMTKPTMNDNSQEENYHRRTNSDSSKIKKAGAYLHVKGKRKAPQPPNSPEIICSASLKRANKRLAPRPPEAKEIVGVPRTQYADKTEIITLDDAINTSNKKELFPSTSKNHLPRNEKTGENSNSPHLQKSETEEDSVFSRLTVQNLSTSESENCVPKAVAELIMQKEHHTPIFGFMKKKEIQENMNGNKNQKKIFTKIPQPQPTIASSAILKDDILSNDSLKLDHGILKPVKEEEQNIYAECSPFPSNYTSGEFKPWYKRHETNAQMKRDFFKIRAHNKENSQDKFREVTFNRNSSTDVCINKLKDKKVEEKIDKKKEDKRKSGLSLLANISELDREAAEIIQKEKLKSGDNSSGIPPFMKPKENVTQIDTEAWPPPKRRSAKDLIAKFNAITNVTKVTVNTALFGTSSKREYFDKQSPKEGKKHQEALLESHKNKLKIIVNKNNSHQRPNAMLPLMKSESVSVMKKPETPKTDRKSWNCPKCYVLNEYWRIICHVCSTIKPYFDDLTVSPNLKKKELNNFSKDESIHKNHYERVLERSKTQIGFSMLSSTNNKQKLDNIIGETSGESVIKNDRRDEREKLKKMLIEMKNSLPKRNSSGKISTRSIISEKFNDHIKTNKIEETTTIEESKKIEERNKIEEISDSEHSSDSDNEDIANNSPTLECCGVEKHFTRENNQQTNVISGKIETTNENNEQTNSASVMIVTKDIIYENIKVKIPTDTKPTKVSSSVQTTSVISKPPEPSKRVSVTAMVKKKNNFEPMKMQEFEDIYSDQDGKSAAKIYANLAQNDDLSLFFNMPTNLTAMRNTLTKIKMQAKNKDTIEINRLLRKLEVAIGKGDMTQAADLAKELAQLRVNCSVKRQRSCSEEKEAEKEGLSVDMYVEDKISHRGPFPIVVLPEQTVGDLKKQIEKEFEIPCNVQRWILGKELATDDAATLKDNNVTKGCSIFLYLVAPDLPTPKKNGEDKGYKNSLPSTSTSQNAEVIVNDKSGPPKVSPEKPNEMPKLYPHIDLSLTEIYSENPEETSKFNAPKIVNAIPKNAEPVSSSDDHTTLNSASCESSSIKTVDISEGSSSTFQPKKHLFSEVVTQTVTTVMYAPGPSLAKPEDDEEFDAKTLKPPPKNPSEWECELCTLLNPITSNICGVCATVRQQPLIKARKKNLIPKPNAPPAGASGQTYLQLMNLDNEDLVDNSDSFECAICFLTVAPQEGATLRDCLHQFCKECLRHTIKFSDDAEVKCPYRDNQYSCNIALQDREIKALVSKEVYDQHLVKSVTQAENKIDKSFHCKTPDCKGWCIYEDNVNEFKCPVCRRVNCLTCQAIHMGLNCKQYQQRMVEESESDENAKQTREMLDKMVKNGEALKCPTCNVVMMKKWGCDWLRCSMCKTEICWVTRGPRWGPLGKGDTSGGCQCGVNGVKCHPKCNYCH